AQLDTLQLNYLHSATMAPTPVPLKLRDDTESRANPRDRRVSSVEASKHPQTENHTIPTIPELSETFEKKLRFRSRNVMSLVGNMCHSQIHGFVREKPELRLLISDADNVCLICHNEMRNDGGAVRELHCSHRFHRECIERWLWKEQLCPTCSVHVAMPEPLYWSSTHLKVP
ncbi:leukemia NUP98 fusion partner 1-like, partial [Scleropages formosus]